MGLSVYLSILCEQGDGIIKTQEVGETEMGIGWGLRRERSTMREKEQTAGCNDGGNRVFCKWVQNSGEQNTKTGNQRPIMIRFPDGIPFLGPPQLAFLFCFLLDKSDTYLQKMRNPGFYIAMIEWQCGHLPWPLMP